MTHCQGKCSWPELEGTTREAAAARIERENPRVDAIVVLNETTTTTDFCCDRVWVRVNSRGIVIQVPGIG
nr:proteinase inhibitor I13 [Tanacetum cinerariifolium]